MEGETVILKEPRRLKDLACYLLPVGNTGKGKCQIPQVVKLLSE
jgi:hypothetical protein